jgi:hypothetical protein
VALFALQEKIVIQNNLSEPKYDVYYLAMARVSYWTVFKSNADGTIEPIRIIRIGGVTLSPGVKMAKGVRFSGIDPFLFYGQDLDVENEGSTTTITGYYPNA